MPEQNKPDQSDQPVQSVGDLFVFFCKHWFAGLVVGLAAAGGLAYWMMSQTPTYEATTTMMLETGQNKSLYGMYGGKDKLITKRDDIINTHFERLRSKQFTHAVAAELSPEQVESLVAPAVDSNNPTQYPDPVGMLRKTLSVDSRSNSLVLILIGKHPDPEVAAWVPNLYAETYLRYLEDLRADSSDNALAFLEEQVQSARAEVEAGEEALQNYGRKNDLVSIEEAQSSVSQKLESLNKSINAHQTSLVTIRSQLKQIDSAGTDPDSISRTPALADNRDIKELTNELEELQQERQMLSSKYLSRHPAMKENQSRIELVTRRLEAAAERRRATLEETRDGIQFEVDILREKIADAEKRARKLDRLSIQYSVLEREVESKRRSYESLIDRLNQTLVNSQLDMNVLRIMDTAKTPGTPVSPSIRKTALAASFVFVLFVVGIPIVLEFLDNRIRTFADIERILAKPRLGDIGKVKRIKADINRGVLLEQEEILECFRNIYSNLHFKENIPPSHALLVTSTFPSEGKTFFAANLGGIYSRHGKKTILVDTDLRSPGLASSLNQPNDKGLLTWLHEVEEKEKREEGNLQDMPDVPILNISENLDLLPAGGSCQSPTEPLTSPHVDWLISRLKESYELVIFDTPPVAIYPDATFLTDYADASIYIVRQHKIARGAARKGINLLEKSRSSILGVVLNVITSNPTPGRRHSDGFRGYSSRYGYKYSKRSKYKKDH